MFIFLGKKMSTSTNKSMADLLNFDFDFEDSFEPVNFDLCIWTQLFGLIFLNTSVWIHLFVLVYLDPFIWICLFGPIYLDPTIWTPPIWTHIFIYVCV